MEPEQWGEWIKELETPLYTQSAEYRRKMAEDDMALFFAAQSTLEQR